MAELPLFVIIFLIFAVIFQLDFLFYVAYVCVGIYVWGKWYTPHALRSLVVRRVYDDHAFQGEYIPITVRVENLSRLPLPWLHFTDTIPLGLRGDKNDTKIVSLRGRGRTELTYRVWTKQRGYYQLGPLRLRVGDLFGFSEHVGRAPATYLTVYPRIIPITKLGLPSRLPFGTIASRQRLFEDPARPTGVRPYRGGDSLRRINWKASAHTNGLLVKTLEPAISLQTSLLVNVDKSDYERRNRYDGPEWAITVAASLAAHLIGQRQPVGLIINGVDPLAGTIGETLAFDKESGRLLLQPLSSSDATGGNHKFELTQRIPLPVPPGRGRGHLMKVLEVLARVEPEETLPFAAWAPGRCVPLSWGTTVLTVTPVGDAATCNMLHRFVRSGLNPVLIVTQRTAAFGAVRDRARQLGFRAYLVTDESELDQWADRRSGIFA